MAKSNSTMKLSPVVGRYFDAWICQDSWDSGHPTDTERFYRFVKAVARYSRSRAPSQADIHALIVQRWRGQGVDRVELDTRANEFAELYRTLLNYEKTRDFPDPLIERTNILEYHLRVSAQCQGNDQCINRMMTEVWGKDWHTKRGLTRMA